ncbi:hypothetical protein E4U42_000900, partial [Claviceps africana]
RAAFVAEAGAAYEKGVDYDYEGRLSVATLADEGGLYLDDKTTEYYVCGPEDWMVQTREELVGRGVSRERVHVELFRTGDV